MSGSTKSGWSRRISRNAISRLRVDEANTLPDFTRLSMYPKLRETSGLSCPDLVEALIRPGPERHRNRQGLLVQR